GGRFLRGQLEKRRDVRREPLRLLERDQEDLPCRRVEQVAVALLDAAQDQRVLRVAVVLERKAHGRRLEQRFPSGARSEQLVERQAENGARVGPGDRV